MSEPYLGEIAMFGGNFAPRGWAFCDGQLLPISSYTALFSILGTTYGGDGRTTFALPDLRGRAPLHQGNGSGLTPKSLGERGGEEMVSISAANLPSHSHTLPVSDETGDTDTPSASSYLADASQVSGRDAHSFSGTSNSAMGNLTTHPGGSLPHNNMQPFTTINYIIALQGLFPSRN